MPRYSIRRPRRRRRNRKSTTATATTDTAGSDSDSTKSTTCTSNARANNANNLSIDHSLDIDTAFATSTSNTGTRSNTKHSKQPPQLWLRFYSLLLRHKMPPSQLSKLICQGNDWERVVETARNRPDQARQWSTRHGLFEGLRDSSVLPLHECLVAEAPVPVTTAVLEAYPDAVKQAESSYRRLPAHCACRRHADPAVLSLLLNYYSEAALVPDALGRLPLHYALSNGADFAVVQLLLQFEPNSARGVDARGWTPLHVATSMGAPVETVRALLQVYPEAVVLKTKKGSSPARCLHKTCPHRRQLKDVLIQAKQEFDATFVSPLDRQKSGEGLDLLLV